MYSKESIINNRHFNQKQKWTYHKKHDFNVGISQTQQDRESRVNADVDQAHDQYESDQYEERLPFHTVKCFVLYCFGNLEVR